MRNTYVFMSTYVYSLDEAMPLHVVDNISAWATESQKLHRQAQGPSFELMVRRIQNSLQTL